ncbi:MULTISPECIES: hypothetical protein [unclassified Streptomyces]|uniref:hypothetical protein n=1 Tax=unclassified Streptomyces TaxID=2593676 RepID=UPI00324B83F9
MATVHARIGSLVLVPTFFLVACTSGGGSQPVHAASASPNRTTTTAAQQEKTLAGEARSALGPTTDDSMVASGLERVSDGLHTAPGLSAGTTYRLSVVCAGTGTAAIEFIPASAAAGKPVTCDGTPVWQRFTAKHAQRVDVDGDQGATGMIAWRIDHV